MSTIDFIRSLGCDVVHSIRVVGYDVQNQFYTKAQWMKNHLLDIDDGSTDRDMDLSYTTED